MNAGVSAPIVQVPKEQSQSNKKQKDSSVLKRETWLEDVMLPIDLPSNIPSRGLKVDIPLVVI